ncbi:MAG: hypothetical protein ACP5I1_20370, partial [Candidatus Hinthialibacter sp.]
VLAQSGDQYGFYRGTQRLGRPPAEDKSARGRDRGGVQEGQAEQYYFDALFSNASRLDRLQDTQSQRWAEQIDPTNNRLMSREAKSFR